MTNQGKRKENKHDEYSAGANAGGNRRSAEQSDGLLSRTGRLLAAGCGVVKLMVRYQASRVCVIYNLFVDKEIITLHIVNLMNRILRKANGHDIHGEVNISSILQTFASSNLIFK